MSLARGLDYYTGIIYEAITSDSAPPSFAPVPAVPPTTSVSSSSAPNGTSKSTKKKAKAGDDTVDEASVGVGSIAGGGRYDNLVGMFAQSAGMGKSDPVPCVGVSVGVERIYSIMESRRRGREEKLRGKETEVYVMNFGKEGLLKERMGLVKALRENGIKVSYGYCGVADACRPNTCSKSMPRTELSSPSSIRNRSPMSLYLLRRNLPLGLCGSKPK